MGIDETIQDDQVDEEERTRKRPEGAPVLDRQAEGQQEVEKRRSRGARKACKGRVYQQVKALVSCVQPCKGQAELQGEVF